MDSKKPFSVKARIQSFIYAFAGLKTFFRNEHNSWIHLFAAVITVIYGAVVHLDKYEWCIILFAIGIVIIAEIFNTAIEALTDIVSPNYNLIAKRVKDMSAAAVLIAAITAAIAGGIIFIPKIIGLIK